MNMSKTLFAAVCVCLAAGASAEEAAVPAPHPTQHRTVSSHHAARHASGPYAVHSAVGAQGTAAAQVHSSAAPGAGSVSYAPGAAAFSNGHPLKAPAHGGGATPRMLRSASGAANQSSGAAAPASAPRGYSASAAGSGTTAAPTPGKIGIDGGKGPAMSGPGVRQGDADSAPGSPGGGASKDPLGAILAGLAGMFKDMANMLGGGSSGNGNGG